MDVENIVQGKSDHFGVEKKEVGEHLIAKI